MRRIIVSVIALMLCVTFLGACQIPVDNVLSSLGSYSDKEYFTSGGFQDYTDYAKYTYKDADLSDNSYFVPMSDDLKERFEEHLVNFEGWVNLISENDSENELVTNYDFDRTLVTDDDYIYIYDDPDYDYLGNYDIYFFDSSTNILYFFHSNI